MAKILNIKQLEVKINLDSNALYRFCGWLLKEPLWGNHDDSSATL